MSKQLSSANGATTKSDADDDICPVCKSRRYLNQNMRFKINPECYHVMCESCVDRIFSHGPAPCPIAGCARTLRKAKFRKQTFEDLEVEREVDIRSRVARAMTKKEEDFETLKDYNDYLEQVEEITWNLILRTDVEETERRLRKWEDYQKAELDPYAVRRAVEPDTSDTSHLKKGATQRKNPKSAQALDSFDKSDDAKKDTGFNFKGLKKRVAPPPEAPFDPFDGWSIEPQYFALQDDYDVDWLTSQKNDPVHLVGGYDMRDFYTRALREAFGGFGVFIEDEINARAEPLVETGVTAVTAGGRDVNMDDVF